MGGQALKLLSGWLGEVALCGLPRAEQISNEKRGEECSTHVNWYMAACVRHIPPALFGFVFYCL